MNTVAYFPVQLVKYALSLQKNGFFSDYEHGFNHRKIGVYSSSPDLSKTHCGSKPLKSVCFVKAIGRFSFARSCYIDCDGGQVWPA